MALKHESEKKNNFMHYFIYIGCSHMHHRSLAETGDSDNGKEYRE